VLEIVHRLTATKVSDIDYRSQNGETFFGSTMHRGHIDVIEDVCLLLAPSLARLSPFEDALSANMIIVKLIRE
jgi:hypothetical protein